jgi:hypothetical protein
MRDILENCAVIYEINGVGLYEKSSEYAYERMLEKKSKHMKRTFEHEF